MPSTLLLLLSPSQYSNEIFGKPQDLKKSSTSKRAAAGGPVRVMRWLVETGTDWTDKQTSVFIQHTENQTNTYFLSLRCLKPLITKTTVEKAE